MQLIQVGFCQREVMDFDGSTDLAFELCCIGLN
jgi:hypothetical protein